MLLKNLKIDTRVLLSTLWIFAVLNYIYADVFTMFFVPGAIEEAMAFTQGSEIATFVFAFLMETSIAMILFARILKHATNRWANIVVGVLHTIMVAGSLAMGEQHLFYIFFAIVEIATTLLIVKIAWQWRK